MKIVNSILSVIVFITLMFVLFQPNKLEHRVVLDFDVGTITTVVGLNIEDKCSIYDPKMYPLSITVVDANQDNLSVTMVFPNPERIPKHDIKCPFETEFECFIVKWNAETIEKECVFPDTSPIFDEPKQFNQVPHIKTLPNRREA